MPAKEKKMTLTIWEIVGFGQLVSLIQNKFRVGLARMERIIKDRMSTADINVINS
jgi:hypothetical protein